MKYPKLYIILLIFISSIFATNSYANAEDSDFILIEKEVQNGIRKEIKYGLAKRVKANAILRGLSSSSATKQVEIIPPIYDNIEETYEDFFRIVKDDKIGLTDKNGKILFNANYDYIKEYGNYLLILIKGEKIGIATRNGKILFDTIHKSIEKYRNYFAILATGRNKNNTVYNALINQKGEIVVDINYEPFDDEFINRIRHLTEGYFQFFKNDSWGLVDELGNIIIDPSESSYTDIIPGDLKVRFRYDAKEIGVKSFILKRPVFYKNANYIPRTRKIVDADAISYIGNDLFVYFKDKKFGIINRKREIVEDFNYDKISLVEDSFILLEDSEKEVDSFKIETSEVKSIKFLLNNVEI